MNITTEQLIHCIMEAEEIIEYCEPPMRYGSRGEYNDRSASIVNADKLIRAIRELEKL